VKRAKLYTAREGGARGEERVFTSHFRRAFMTLNLHETKRATKAQRSSSVRTIWSTTALWRS
jgi:hypothetical protein